MSLNLSLTNRAANELTFSLVADEDVMTQVVLELNRSPDFSSDDTIFKLITGIGNGTSSQTVRGLPSGTTWHIRALSNGSGAAYSNIVVAATTEVATATAYAGFSVDKSLLVDPVTIASISDGYGANNARLAGFPPFNLLRDDPQSTWQVIPSVGAALHTTLTFQTSGEPIDTVAILGTLASDDMIWSISSAPTVGGFGGAGSTASGDLPFRCSPSIGRRQYYHALYSLPAPTTNRFWSITITSSPLVHSVSFIARQLVLGLARQSTNPSQGASESISDTGTFSRGRFGTPDRVAGWRGRAVSFEMSWLRETEYQAKWAPVLTLVGKTKSVLALANGKRNVWTNDRLAFGPITDMQGENMKSSRHSVGIAIDSLY